MGFTFAQNRYAGASKAFANAFRQHASHGSKTRWCEGFLREKTVAPTVGEGYNLLLDDGIGKRG